MSAARAPRIQFSAMNRAYHCLAVFLALVVAVAPAVLAAPAASMTLQMTMLGDSGDCCPDANGNHTVCPVTCVNSLTLATIPDQPSIIVRAFGHGSWQSGSLAMTDRRRPPDPPPPKSASLL